MAIGIRLNQSVVQQNPGCVVDSTPLRNAEGANLGTAGELRAHDGAASVNERLRNGTLDIERNAKLPLMDASKDAATLLSDQQISRLLDFHASSRGSDQ